MSKSKVCPPAYVGGLRLRIPLDHLRHVLRVWRNQAKTQRERRVESEKRAREKDQRLLQNAFEVWYSRHRERSLVEAVGLGFLSNTRAS